jgi:hypothetical protein
MSQRTVRRIIAVPFILVLLTLGAGAQQAAIGFCALNKTLDFKTAKAGDKIALHLTRDLPRTKVQMPCCRISAQQPAIFTRVRNEDIFQQLSSILGLQAASKTDAFHLFKKF